MLFCREIEPLKCFHITKDCAEEILNEIGFGKEYCKQTYEKDKRYGRILDNRIEFGFENSMHGTYWYGHYIVFRNEDYTWEYLSEKGFKETYEIIL